MEPDAPFTKREARRMMIIFGIAIVIIAVILTGIVYIMNKQGLFSSAGPQAPTYQFTTSVQHEVTATSTPATAATVPVLPK